MRRDSLTNYTYLLLTYMYLTLPSAEAIIVRSNSVKLRSQVWVGSYIWYSEEGTGRAAAPPSPLLALPNVTATYVTYATSYCSIVL